MSSTALSIFVHSQATRPTKVISYHNHLEIVYDHKLVGKGGGRHKPFLL